MGLTTRRAFTLIELLAALIVVAILAAISLVAIEKIREAARRAQCASQFRQVGVALAAYHTLQRTFPPAGIWSPPGEPLGEGELPIGVIDRVARFGTPENDTIYGNWLIALLPHLEQLALYDLFDARVPISHERNKTVRTRELAVLRCPSDVFNSVENRYQRGSAAGLLTNEYARGNAAINGGPDGNCVSGMKTEDGPCIGGFIVAGGDLMTKNDQVWGSGIAGVNRSFRLTDIADGAAQTVAVDEIRAGVDPLDPRGVWALGQIGASAVARHGKFDDAGQPNHGSASGEAFIGCTALTAKAGGTLIAQRMTCYAVGLEYERNVQAGARSMHPGGVNLLWCDGAARFVADDVDPNVWHAIHTRNQGEPLNLQ